MKTFLIFLFYITTGFGQNAGDIVFSGSQVYTFVFHFDQPDFLDSLYKTNADKDYTLGHVTINGVLYDSVGVRFKGSSSFHGYPGNKKSFRIKFHEYKDHNFDGLRRINLNNGWSDPTMLREKLYLDFLYEEGITAPRANFARVYIDSVYWGLYTMVEQIDKTFLSHRYSENDGNLYKALGQSKLDWKGTNQENYYKYYNLKTNEKRNDQSDLVHLLDVINNYDKEHFPGALDSILTINEFIRSWSANNFIINLDSYFGSANNFYLYHNEINNKFNWIIWDTNLTFGGRTSKDSLDIYWREWPRPLIDRLLQDDQFKSMYIESLNQLLNTFDEQKLYLRIDTLFNLIKPDLFADTLKMYSNEEAEQNLVNTVDRNPGLKTFIVNRKKNVAKQLALYVNHIENSDEIPGHIVLYQNYPNPFNAETIIQYQIESTEYVKLKIYNLPGQEVNSLVEQIQQAGRYSVQWNAVGFSSGIYFYVLQTGHSVQYRKMILIK